MKTIKSKMLVWFGTVIVILLILLGFAMSGLIRSTIVPLIEDTIMQAVVSGSREIGGWINSHKDSITLLANLPVIKEGSLSDIQAYLKAIDESPDIQLLFYADNRGNYYSGDGHIGSISSREYFQTIMSGQEDLIITSPLISTSQGNEIFVVAHAVRDNSNNVKGVIAATISLDKLSEVVSGLKSEDGRYGWIIDDKGNVLAHKDIYKRLSFNLLKSAEHDYSRLDMIGQKMIDGQSGLDFYISPDQERISMAYSPIPGTPGWSLASSISEADLLIRANVLLIKLVIMLISILIAIIVIIDVLSNVITKPLSLAVDHLGEISKENFESRLPEECLKRQDELGVLSRGIDSMQTSIKELLSRTRYMAYNDTLTGLPNRTRFIHDVDKLIEDIGQSDQSFSILTIDLDNFKDTNDTMGHTTGDLLLKHVAEILVSVAEANNGTSYRHGGDQFIVLFKDASSPEALEEFANTIYSHLSEPFNIKEQDLFIMASMGGVIYPDHGDSAEILLQMADLAMNYGKSEGKGKYLLFKEKMNRQITKKINMVKSLRQAIEDEEFFLTYQPIISPKTGEIECVEALLRWDHPIKGVVMPADFIPLAEETGLIVPLGEWILYEACRQNKEWQDKGYEPFKISVNISIRQLQGRDFVKTIKKTLEKTGLDAKHLTLEVTESEFMKYIDTLKEILEDLSQIGVGVSLDDFGIGYSSFSYLKHLPINTLKVDKSFIDDIDLDKERTITGAIIILAHMLKLKVVAEGVETYHQYEFLSSQGCDLLQGFFFSEPKRAKELEDDILNNGLLLDQIGRA